MNREMNVGQFVAAEIIILLVLASVEKLVLSFETIYDMLTALEKIGQVTDLELEEERGLVATSEASGMSVGMNELNFRFPGENRKVLKNVGLYIRPGERVLVTGKNDSGKSTLLYLMGGLYAPISGSLTLDDIPLKNYHPAYLRAQIGSYLREEQLFEATLLENITLGRAGVNFEHVKEIVEALGMKDIICSLPEGYDTAILPQGRQFSKSTIAKILLARAVAGNPRLLLLENSFSVFQPKEREAILSYLYDRNHTWTLVMTSPREDVPDAWLDQKIVLDKGHIILP
jgi:ABC-type bacteriocin/lantibiotic exporter with double-glycine peptidase domain